MSNVYKITGVDQYTGELRSEIDEHNCWPHIMTPYHHLKDGSNVIVTKVEMLMEAARDNTRDYRP